MQGQTLENPTSRPPIDRFVYRMLAGIVMGIAVLNAGFATNTHLQRIPNLKRVLESVKLESVGRGGEWLLNRHFLVTSAAIGALGVSIGAFRNPTRSVIVFSYSLNFIAIAMTIAAEVAITRVWTRILSRVLQ